MFWFGWGGHCLDTVYILHPESAGPLVVGVEGGGGWGFPLNSLHSLLSHQFLRVVNLLFCSFAIRYFTQIKEIARQNRAIRLKNSYFSYVFDNFSPFYVCTRENHSRCSSLIRSFLKSHLSNSLMSLITKERQ